MKYNKETPFEIKSEEDWKKIKLNWCVSYTCNECGKKHVKRVCDLKYAKNTCLNKISHYKKETPFEIKSEEDWKKVKVNWYVSYTCNECGKKHVKRVGGLKWAKNTCYDRVSGKYGNKETPFEIKSEEDWKKVKHGWYVSYICNECGERHIKSVSDLKNAKNTCFHKAPYRNKETPYEIKSGEDLKKVKLGWYIKYRCEKCGLYHIRNINNKNQLKFVCLNTNIFHDSKTPFEIKSEEDWKKVKKGWFVKYHCKICGLYHTIRVIDNNIDKMKACITLYNVTNLNQYPYLNKQMPFSINNNYDWVIVRPGWYVKYRCLECHETHIRKITNELDKGFKCIK